jgi:hypothetical protein
VCLKIWAQYRIDPRIKIKQSQKFRATVPLMFFILNPIVFLDADSLVLLFPESCWHCCITVPYVLIALFLTWVGHADGHGRRKGHAQEEHRGAHLAEIVSTFWLSIVFLLHLHKKVLVLSRGGHTQLYFESATTILQLEGSTSATASPQLQFFLKSAT